MTALVMELVEGDDLAQRISRGAIPLDEAIPIAKQIAEALEAAHEQGIIHRDLKPANIQVRPEGTLKVLDFGLAKATEPASTNAPSLSRSPTITSPAMTQAGMILGTAAYMSPEQARGKPVDKRADIWACGVVLYEMLTGAGLFAGDSIPETLGLIFSRETGSDGAATATPPRVRALIARCLVKDPRHRLRDIGDARLELDDVGDSDGRAAAAPTPTLWRVLPWGLALAMALLAGGAGVREEIVHRLFTVRPSAHLSRPPHQGSRRSGTVAGLDRFDRARTHDRDGRAANDCTVGVEWHREHRPISCKQQMPGGRPQGGRRPFDHDRPLSNDTASIRSVPGSEVRLAKSTRPAPQCTGAIISAGGECQGDVAR